MCLLLSHLFFFFFSFFTLPLHFCCLFFSHSLSFALKYDFSYSLFRINFI